MKPTSRKVALEPMNCQNCKFVLTLSFDWSIGSFGEMKSLKARGDDSIVGENVVR